MSVYSTIPNDSSTFWLTRNGTEVTNIVNNPTTFFILTCPTRVQGDVDLREWHFKTIGNSLGSLNRK